METRGDVITRGLWDRHTNATIKIKIGDAYADTYTFELLVMLLAWWEKMKKDKNGKHCHDQWKQFSQFVLSVYGMLGREALVVLANLIRLMAAKMDEPIFHMGDWNNGRIEKFGCKFLLTNDPLISTS